MDIRDDALLDLARAQLLRLQEGDVDRFLEEERAYNTGCVTFAASAAAGERSESVVRELVTVTTAISAELQRLMGETNVRLAELNARRRVAGAYLPAAANDAVSQRNV